MQALTAFTLTRTAGFSETDFHAYTTSSQSWHVVARLPPPRTNMKLVAHNRKLYQFGGSPEYGLLPTGPLFVLRQPTTDELPSTTSAVPPPSKTLSEPKLQMYEYDLAEDFWTALPTPDNAPPGRLDPGSVVYNDRMYIFSGFHGCKISPTLAFFPFS